MGFVSFDADIIYETIKNNLSPLLEATRLFIKTVSE